jgi:hypothetical protein
MTEDTLDLSTADIERIIRWHYYATRSAALEEADRVLADRLRDRTR